MNKNSDFRIKKMNTENEFMARCLRSFGFCQSKKDLYMANKGIFCWKTHQITIIFDTEILIIYRPIENDFK